VKNILNFEDFLNEAVKWKMKTDFSGIRWEAALMGTREYRFRSGDYDYIVTFNIEEIISTKEYILTMDIRTKQKEFELIPVKSPFELSSTIGEIHRNLFEDFDRYGYILKGLRIYYSREEGEDRNVRSIFFNRAIDSALKDLKKKWTMKTHIDSRLNKFVCEYIF
jgi:hypothetical protein